LVNIGKFKFRFWHNTRPFYRIFRTKENNQNILVFESEFLDTLNPTFSPKILKVQKLCNGDLFMPLKVEIWDNRKNGDHVYVGSFNFNLNDIVTN
jgi:hypothetical protein